MCEQKYQKKKEYVEETKMMKEEEPRNTNEEVS
jgi:hypothetical protein